MFIIFCDYLLLAFSGFCVQSSLSFEKMSSIESGSLEFALNLQKSLANNQNLVVSPFSLSTALAMTLYGSRNNSAAELSKVLFGKSIDVKEYQPMVTEFQLLIEKSVKSNSQVLSSANFIYGHKNYPILQDFSETIKKYFSAKAQELDFISGNAEAIKTINKDISEATKGKIATLFDSIDVNTKLILANALYFKGFWKSQFQTNHTQLKKFKTCSNEEIDVQMMFQSAKFPFVYSEELEFKAIELSYDNSNVVMIVLLPNQNNLKQLQSNLNTQKLNDLLLELNSPKNYQKVDLSLPKFKLESTLNLIPVLSELGIKEIFDVKSANFSGITSDPLGLFVGDVIQKAIIEVNEEGTEAAAATGVAFLSRSLQFPEQFEANHPFMFLLITKFDSKNVILFSGTVNNPNK